MEILRRLFARRSVRVIAGLFLVLAAGGALSAPVAFAAPATTSPGIFDTIANIIGGIFMYAASGVGSLISNIIEVIVAVIQYNNFSSSPVVGAGWAIIRDTVNMFYVVLLIIIAFGTIIGSDRFKWAQDVPKLLRWAIIINFSKTLCGLMIDASQVVTLTFANAIKDIAGGNFVTFLGLNSILSLSTSTPDLMSGNPGGYAPYDFMFGGIMAFVMMLIVLVVLVALLAILVFRIVMLWILITISPLTWFAGSQKVLGDATGAYKKWWGDFKCYLAVGPVLVFFLWLALAVAGAGNIAAVEGFNVTDSNNGGLINQIFDMPRLTSFILGLALIMAGFQQAASVCSGAQGGSVIKGILGKAEGLTKTIARKPTDLGLAGGRAVANRIPLVGNKPLIGGVGRNQIGAGASRMAAAAAGTLGLGGAAKYFAGKKGEFEKADKEVVTETAARRDAIAGSFTDDGKKKSLESIYAKAKEGEKAGTAVLGRDRSLAVAELKKAVEDKDARKKMGAANFDAMVRTYGKELEDTYGKDDKFKGALKDFKKGRADLFTPKGADGKTDWKAALKDYDAAKAMDWEAVRGMSNEEKTAIAGVLKGISNTKEYDAAGKEMNAYELLEKGKLGKGVKADVLSASPPEGIAALIERSYSPATGTFADASDGKRYADAVKADPVANIPDIATRVAATGGKDVELSRAAIAAMMGGGKGSAGKSGELLAQVAENKPNAAGARKALVGTAQILHNMPPTKENEKKLKGLVDQWKNAGLGDLTAEAAILPVEDREIASQLGRTKKAYRDDNPEQKRLVELDDAAFQNEAQTLDNDIADETRRAAAATSDAEKARNAAALAELNARKAEVTKAQVARYAQMPQATFTATQTDTDADIARADQQIRTTTDDQTRALAQQQKAALEARQAMLKRVQGIRAQAERVAALPQEEGKKKKGRA